MLYYLDPYTLAFDAHVVWTQGPFVVLDRTFFCVLSLGYIAVNLVLPLAADAS